jgi:hypothetical protein
MRTTSTIKFWSANVERKGYFADQGTGEKLILGWMLKKCIMKCELDLSGCHHSVQWQIVTNDGSNFSVP